MHSSHTPHRTLLKRVSQGSLFALSRSGAFPDAPHGLGFLEAAVSEFADEMETLQANVEAMKDLSSSLATFNESFASWLYIMDMNALTTDWLQAPTDASFSLAKKRAEENATKAMEALILAKQEAGTVSIARTMVNEGTEGEITFAENVTASTSSQITNSVASQKKNAKRKMTVKEKKERDLEIERIISCLPLEYRGSDPNLRHSMERVIVGILESSTRAVRLTDLVKLPDLTQARVNKCLIALTNRKVVRKDNSTGTVLFHWQGIP